MKPTPTPLPKGEILLCPHMLEILSGISRVDFPSVIHSSLTLTSKSAHCRGGFIRPLKRTAVEPAVPFFDFEPTI